MAQTGIPFVTGTLRERVVIALFSLPLAAGCVWAAIAGESVIRDIGPGTLARSFGFAVFRFLCTELFAAAAAFLLFGFVWATFQSQWVTRVLLTVSRHVWRYVCVLLLNFLVLALVLAIVEHVA
jgi:hypothetical protein